MKMLHQKKKKKSINPPIKKSVINTLTEKKPNHKYCTTYQRQELGEKMVSDRKTDRAERKREERRMRRVKPF